MGDGRLDGEGRSEGLAKLRIRGAGHPGSLTGLGAGDPPLRIARHQGQVEPLLAGEGVRPDVGLAIAAFPPGGQPVPVAQNDPALD